MTTRSIPRPFEIGERPAPAEVLLWPNLLTLQAPVVAALWQLLLAQSLHLRLNPFETVGLALAVWLIYVADHLIDTARPVGISWEPPRKEFCRRHWYGFLCFSIAAGFSLTALASHYFWAATVRAGWQLSLAVGCYFALIHVAPASWRSGWPREVAVATVFTLGTFLAVWVANGRNVASLLIPGALFLSLCWTNCSLIETWEWEATGSIERETPNPAARFGARHLRSMGALIALVSALLWMVSLLPKDFAEATFLSGGALALLARYRSAIPIRFVSPAADLALCAPVIVLAFRTVV